MYLRFLPILFFTINFLLLFNRKKKWAVSRYRWYFVWILFLCGGVLYVLYRSHKVINMATTYGAMMTPLIFSLTDMLLKRISLSIHQRDYYLRLRGSSEEHANVKASDMIFSIFMLLYGMFLFIFFMAIIH